MQSIGIDVTADSSDNLDESDKEKSYGESESVNDVRMP